VGSVPSVSFNGSAVCRGNLREENDAEVHMASFHCPQLVGPGKVWKLEDRLHYTNILFAKQLREFFGKACYVERGIAVG
jgi:hypothetical protein